jgi:NADH dehydrogenase
MSAAGASANHPVGWLRAKHEAEQIVRESGLDGVILRPSSTYGPGDRELSRLADCARRFGVVPVIGSGSVRRQPISVFDVARVAASSVALEGASSRAFDLAGPETYSSSEIARMLCRLVGRRCRIVHLPTPFLKFTAGLFSILPSPPYSVESIELARVEILVDPSPAQRHFGIAFTKLEDGLRAMLSEAHQ